MSQESDISWQVLRRIARQWAGDAAELREVRPLDGGTISTTLALALDGNHRAVLKISAYRVDRSYQAEAHQLNLLRSVGLPTPRVYDHKIGTLDEPFSYLLMEFVDGVDLQEARRQASPDQYDQLQCELAELLANLHEKTGSHYMRVQEEESTRFETWPPFFKKIFDAIWADEEKSDDIPVKYRRQIGKIHQRLDILLEHDDQPRLVHWDVWSSNVLAAPDSSGRWHIKAILDPACKFAHVEAELAYMDLFHTSTPAFLKTYQRQRRLSPEYHRLRKHVYQMYFLLNHVHLFGQQYLRPLLATVDKVAAAM